MRHSLIGNRILTKKIHQGLTSPAQSAKEMTNCPCMERVIGKHCLIRLSLFARLFFYSPYHFFSEEKTQVVTGTQPSRGHACPQRGYRSFHYATLPATCRAYANSGHLRQLTILCNRKKRSYMLSVVSYKKTLQLCRPAL